MALSAGAAGKVDEAPAASPAELPQSPATDTGTESASGGAIITPTDGTAPAPRVRAGPSIEMITGGNSADGAAKVGRLPILQ